MRRLTLLAGLLLVAAVPTLTSAQGAGPRAWVADAHVDAPLPYDPHPAGFDPFAEGRRTS